MPIELSHLGEDLIAEMLNSLAVRQELSRVTCAITNRSFAQDILDCHLGDSPVFLAEDASLEVRHGDCTYACDGEQKVDVLCVGDGHAIALEAKLGQTRMAFAEFRRRFCGQCKTSHAESRLSGSMIAVLERSLPFEGTSSLAAHVDDSQWSLAIPWWLIVRQSVFQKWAKTRDFPVTARVLVFDHLAQLYGTKQQFDQMVQRILGRDFAGRWGVPLRDSP